MQATKQIGTRLVCIRSEGPCSFVSTKIQTDMPRRIEILPRHLAMLPVPILMLISPVGSSASTSGSRTSHVQRRDDGTRAQSLDTRTDRSTFLIFDVQNIHEEQAGENSIVV